MYRNHTLAELQQLRRRNQWIQNFYAPALIWCFSSSGYWQGLVMRQWDIWNHWNHVGGIILVILCFAAGIWSLIAFVRAREARIAIDQFIDYGLYKVAVDPTEPENHHEEVAQ